MTGRPFSGRRKRPSARITGERVSSPEAGFNPAWQRHRAAYALAGHWLGPGLVLDLGCGVGHSYALLAPRETIGVDIEADVLVEQHRPTVAADMRALPFEDDSFASVISVHSIEHVPDPERAVAEASRVLMPDGVAVFVTPNRLTFGRPGEIIDPYHHIEFSACELTALCRRFFPRVEAYGLFASSRYMELFDEERVRLDRLLRADPLRLRRRIPLRAKQVLYDRLLNRYRKDADPRARSITPEDFHYRAADLSRALDVTAVCFASCVP